MSFSEILNLEEKKYLRFFSKYLQSYGEKTGTFRFEDSDPDEWKHVLNRSLNIDENYYLEIPQQVNPIVSKILKQASENGYSDFDQDCNYNILELQFDTRDNSISLVETCQYTLNEGHQMEWSVEEYPDDKPLKECFKEIKKLGKKELTVDFNGYGDSGGIEGDYPSIIEDFCYGLLESNFGGWEINEGSHGSFYFNTETKTVNLDFNWHNENTETNTLYEEKFDK